MYDHVRKGASQKKPPRVIGRAFVSVEDSERLVIYGPKEVITEIRDADRDLLLAVLDGNPYFEYGTHISFIVGGKEYKYVAHDYRIEITPQTYKAIIHVRKAWEGFDSQIKELEARQ